jgi:SPX domain protein involved in polyphosphate accumulation
MRPRKVRGLRLESWKSRTGLWWAVSKDGSRFVSWTDAQVDKVWTFVYKKQKRVDTQSTEERLRSGANRSLWVVDGSPPQR